MALQPSLSHSLKICMAGAPQKRRPMTVASSAGEMVPFPSRSKRSNAFRMALSLCTKRLQVAAATNSLRSISESLTRSMLSKMRWPSSRETPRAVCNGPVSSAFDSVPLPSMSSIRNCASARSTSAPPGNPSAYTSSAAAARFAGLSKAKSRSDCKTSEQSSSLTSISTGRSALPASQGCRMASLAVMRSAGQTLISLDTKSFARSLTPCQASPVKSSRPRMTAPVISTSVLPWKGFCPVRTQQVITPTDHMSQDSLWPFLRSTSGAMKSSVPAVFCSCPAPGARTRERPKSTSFSTSPSST
mmetsp:Transcript_26552/g.72070  ORF Transcript_26552/g.72070 Transcript_26552/m.72070 type:complete len:302 (+) Transcript_26552:141-1046(+)